MSKKEKLFTTKDIDKIKKALVNAGVKPLKENDWVELTQQEFNTLMKMDRWANNVLETAEKLNYQCNKN